MSTFEIVEVDPQVTAVVQSEAPLAELPGVFERAFHDVMKVVAEQGVAVTGPPIGYYPRPPGATIEVAAGFPVAAPVAPSGDVVVLELPGGRAVQTIHVGPFDTLERTYEDLVAWVTEQGLELAEHMWETYLSDPAAEPDPAHWRTLITWPLR